MYIIEKEKDLEGKIIKHVFLSGNRFLNEQYDSYNFILVLTSDNGLFVRIVRPVYDDDDDACSEVCFSFLKYNIISTLLTTKESYLRRQLINQYKIKAEEIDSFFSNEAKKRDEKEQKEKEMKQIEKLKTATHLTGMNRRELTKIFKNKYKKGDLIKLESPNKIIETYKYAEIVKNGEDEDFCEDIIDIGLSHVYLIDSFKSAIGAVLKIIDTDDYGAYVEYVDTISSTNFANITYLPFEFFSHAE